MRRRSRKTRGVCPECGEIVPAEVVVGPRLAFLRGNCPVHGGFEAPVSAHADFYGAVEALTPVVGDTQLRFEGDAPHAAGVFFDVSTRCNLRCACCLAQAGTVELPEPTLDEAVAFLARLPRKPVVYLSGGEPTLRADLPEWISRLTALGYAVKLLTNGVRAADPAYVETLARAGLKWIMIQFDSTSDETLTILRGRPLAEVRRRAVENSAAAGMNIVLPCVIHQGLNEDEIWDLVRYAAVTPGVRQITLLPAKRQGVWKLGAGVPALEPVELMDLLQRQSGGSVGRADFLRAYRLQAAGYRLTGREQLAVRRCFFALPLLRNGGRPIPLLSPAGLVRGLGEGWSVLRSVVSGRPVEETADLKDLLILTIESFRELESLDVNDAALCPRYFYDGRTITPGCLYNLLYRGKG